MSCTCTCGMYCNLGGTIRICDSDYCHDVLVLVVVEFVILADSRGFRIWQLTWTLTLQYYEDHKDSEVAELSGVVIE